MDDLFGDLTSEVDFYPVVSKEDSYGRTIYLIDKVFCRTALLFPLLQHQHLATLRMNNELQFQEI